MFGKKQKTSHHGISNDFRDRCATLKLLLINYVIENHPGAIEIQMDSLVDELGGATESDVTHAIDAAIHETRFANGEHILDRFVANHDDLREDDAKLVLSWRDWLFGVFRVTSSDGSVADSINLVDGLEYRLVATEDSLEVKRALRRGGYIVSRIVPIENNWMISGEQQLLEKGDERLAYGLAGQLAQKSPRLFFRNPANLALAREQLQDEYRRFLADFGAPWIMGTWDVIQDHWRRFTLAKADEEFKVRGEKLLGLPSEMRNAETVGLIFDPEGGMFFLEDFGQFLAALNDPGRLSNPAIRSTVHGYLTEHGVAPRIFELVWQRRPAQLNSLLGALLGQSEFDWGRLGEDCLREHNPLFLDQPQYPGLLPLNRKQVEGIRYLQEQQALAEAEEMSAVVNHLNSTDLIRKGTKTTNETARNKKRKSKLAKQSRKRNRR